MEPIEYVRALVRRWPIVAVAAFIGALFAFFGTDPKPAPIQVSYSATNTLLINGNQFGSQTQIGTITFAQVPVFATVGEVPRLVAQKLNYPGPPAALAARVSVNVSSDNGTLTFTSNGTDPDEVVRIADAFADETVSYLAQRQEQLRQDRLTTALTRANDLEQKVRDLDAKVAADPKRTDSVTLAQRDAAVRNYSVAYQSYTDLTDNTSQDINLTMLERAQPVQQQTGGFTPPRTRASRVPIAAGLGALLGAGLALLVERLDSRVRDRRRAEQAFATPVVAELPTLRRSQRGRRLLVSPEDHHAISEAFRSLRTSVTFLATEGEPDAEAQHIGVVVVTSPSPAEGKTTTAANLAAAFAETGRSVIVVNADFRRPALTLMLISGQRMALPAGLSGLSRVPAEQYLIDTDVPGLRLLDLSPLGANAGDLTRATVSLVRRLRDEADVIIVDTPPLAVTAEALEFVPTATVLLLMARIGRTRAVDAQRAGELARFAGAPHIAAVLADSGNVRTGRSRYYDYYGGSGTRRKSADAPAADRDASSGDGSPLTSAGTNGHSGEDAVAVDLDPEHW